ncbi:hypothetical protein CERSUDRAFT_118223 [Gelatoporia subvermispora B]|uniref:MI domain-containing protein n=1 Tax=Ceriporiopsis subvermispora (strain B) TaxID=914234 RepID=M2R2N2_CERS8|nr:hypothetical protein CERSUDRAFT_118223 [Gelatoporia subvermispora B]
MSKSATASTPRNPTQLPQKSAWARGPPQSTSTAPTSRSQSPAPNASASAAPTHSRRPSALGQGVSFKDGVAGARSPTNTVKSGSVTFGSIDDVSAPISSSPAAAPAPIKAEGVKTFGSVAAAPPVSTQNGKPAASVPVPAPSASTSALKAGSAAAASASTSASTSTSTPLKMAKPDIKKLFQGPSSSGPASSAGSSPGPNDVSSPSSRPSMLPGTSSGPSGATQGPGAQAVHGAPPSQLGAGGYTPFVPGQMRGQQNGAGGGPPPRSPVYGRAMANGSNMNGRQSGAPGGPGGPGGIPAGMQSPRVHAGQPAGMPPHAQMQVPAWPGYYYAPAYPGMPVEGYMYPSMWQVQQQVPPQHQHHQPPGPPGSAHPGMPMSPRHQPPPLHAPSTPTLAPAIPSNGHPPHTPSPHTHTASLSSVSSPPSTPSTLTGSGGPSRLSSNASSFVPRKPPQTPVIIKTQTGETLNLEEFKKEKSSAAPSPTVIESPARKPVTIRIENPEEKAREKEKKEAEEKAKHEAEERARKEKEEAERKKKEDAERKRKEEEEREQKRKEEEEERRRKAEEEKERAKQEEEEKLRLQKVQKEEEERRQREEEERATREAEEAKVTPEAQGEATPEQEEGEVEEKDTSTPQAADETPKEEDKSQDKASLRIDTAVSSPEVPRKRPGPLDLSGTKQPIAAPLPSALATARIIEDLGSVQYPEGIKSPRVELNVNAKQGKFRYDRDFLLQFMAICREKPDSLPPLDAIGLEPADQNYPMSRGGSGRRSSSAAMPPPQSNARVGLGISGFGKPGNFTMGQFSTPAARSSEERFMASRSASMGGGPIPFGGRSTPMTRSSSQGGPGGNAMGSNRTRSKRGEKRGEGNKPSMPSFTAPGMQPGFSLEPVAPLEMSVNRWQPNSLGKKQVVPEDSPEIVDRKVRGLLNKLTMERFESISDQIISWANKSENEKDGRTLIQVIRLVFEKATDEAAWSEMYARLCRKMMEQISPKVQDEGIKNSEGKPIAGGQLFRKYLLNRCQEDFERGWVAKEATAAAAKLKATEDEAAKAEAEKNDGDEAALYSEEYYTAQKAKRQGLGLIKFIGELFKLQMLTERIMHECVKKLLGNVENPEEEEIESLCKLLSTVGKLLDTQKARAHMDVYFSRMKDMAKSNNVNSRMQFMLQDVIELRERNWIPRNAVAAPTTIAAVHEQAAKEKAAAERDAINQRNAPMSRGGSRRGGERGDHQVGPDGWAVAGGAAPRPAKAGDLSNFGKINKTTSMTFGPTSVFSAKDKGKRDSTISRAGSTNMFSMLRDNPEVAAEVTAAPRASRPPSRKASIDLGSQETSEPAPMRRKLNLLPRTLPKPEEQNAGSTPAASEAASDDEAETSEPSMTEEEAKTRIKEDSKEFFSIRDLDEAEVYFTKLPSQHRWRLVDKLVSSAIESKEADAQLVADFFDRAVSKDLCSPSSFEEGFAPVAEVLDDIAIDAPKAVNLMAIMIKGAHLHEDEERRTRLASKSMDSDKLLSLLS